MTENMAQLQREIDAEKSVLADNIAQLEAKARKITDWRGPVRKHPLGAIGVALAAGAAISILTRRRKIVVVHRPEPAVDGTAAAAPAPSLMSHPVVERVVDALVAVAAAKVVGVLSEMLPDFNQHFAKDEPVPGRANGATASPEAIERRFNTAAAPH